MKIIENNWLEKEGYSTNHIGVGAKNKEDDARLDIKINGDEVVEVDFSNLHFRIASSC